MLETCNSISAHVPTYQHVTSLQCTHAIAEMELFYLHEIKHLCVYFITEVYTCMTLQNCTAEDVLPPGLPVNPESNSVRAKASTLSHSVVCTVWSGTLVITGLNSEPLCGHPSQSAGASLEWTAILFNWQDKSVKGCWTNNKKLWSLHNTLKCHS